MFKVFSSRLNRRVVALSGSALLGLAISSQALAIVSGQVNYGKRSASSKMSGTSDTYSADEYTAGVWLDPIPLVPVAFGGSMIIQNWDKDDFGATTTGSQLTLDVKGWLPMVPVVTPYVKVSYILNGQILAESTGTKGKYSVTGTQTSLGLTYGILPLVSLAAEYGIGAQKIKVDEITVGGVEVSGTSESSDWNSSAFSFGINVGI
jgi:hypothetical protein